MNDSVPLQTKPKRASRGTGGRLWDRNTIRSKHGNEKCTYIRPDGTRCARWALLGNVKCYTHHDRRNGYSETMSVVYKFKSPKLQEQFDELLKDPDKLDLSNEIQLMRMCLGAVVKKISADTEDLEGISGNEIAALAALAKEIHGAVDTMSRVEQKMQTMITIEQIMLCAEAFATVMLPFVPITDHEEALHALRHARMPFMSPHGQKAANRRALALMSHPWNAEKVAAGESQQFTAKETQARPKVETYKRPYTPKPGPRPTGLADDGELDDWDPNEEQPEEDQDQPDEQNESPEDQPALTP